jgi:hypothetical protein
MNENSSGLQSKPRYEILDGLRGVAAMMVVAFHIFEARRNWLAQNSAGSNTSSCGSNFDLNTLNWLSFCKGGSDGVTRWIERIMLPTRVGAEFRWTGHSASRTGADI